MESTAATTAQRPMSGFLECQAGQYMTRQIISVSPKVTLAELQALFAKHDFNAFPVLDNGKLAGIVTKLDALRAFAFTPDHMKPLYHELLRVPVSAFLTSQTLSVEPKTPLTRVLQLMVTTRVRSVVVIDAGQLVGIISREDILRALRETEGQEPPS
jgi:CBS domain-containing protein